MADSKKVLIVDDDADFATVLENRLKQGGYQVVVAQSGEEALATVKTILPDLILLDLGLPDLPGDIAALRIKSENGNRVIPIIALTGHGDPLTRSTTRAMGFVDHIVKPYESEDLFKRIEKALENSNTFLTKRQDEKPEEDTNYR